MISNRRSNVLNRETGEKDRHKDFCSPIQLKRKTWALSKELQSALLASLRAE